MLIATHEFAAKLNATGSEVTVAPAFIVTDALPLNVNCLIVDVVMPLPPVEAAMLTFCIVRAVEQVLFENFNRTILPPIETLTTCRNVLLAKYGEGGLLPDATAYGAQPQVPTQMFCAERLHETNDINNAPITDNVLFEIFCFMFIIIRVNY
jgi:hypothetical protein